MAVLFITEYSEFGVDSLGKPMLCGKEPAIAEQTIAIGGASVQSAAFNTNTRLIRVHTDAICSVLCGTNPTAATTSGRMAANQTEFRAVQPSTKLAVIANT